MDSWVSPHWQQRITPIRQQQPLIQITFSPQIQRWLSLFFFPACLGKSTLINQTYWFCQQIKTKQNKKHIYSDCVMWLSSAADVLDSCFRLLKEGSARETRYFSKMFVIQRELKVDLQKSEAASLREQSFYKSNTVHEEMNHFLEGKLISMIRHAAFTVLQMR